MTTERKKYVVEGESYWYTPFKTDQYADDKYTITIGNLTPESLALLDQLGVNVTDSTELENEKRHEQGMCVRWKSDYPIKTIDVDKTPWPEDVLIGNKSKIRVVFFPVNWTYKKNSGIRAIPTMVQVVDLVEYAIGKDVDVLEEFEKAGPTKLAEAPKKTKKRVVDDEELSDDLSDLLN